MTFPPYRCLSCSNREEWDWELSKPASLSQQKQSVKDRSYVSNPTYQIPETGCLRGKTTDICPVYRLATTFVFVDQGLVCCWDIDRFWRTQKGYKLSGRGDIAILFFVHADGLYLWCFVMWTAYQRRTSVISSVRNTRSWIRTARRDQHWLS